MNQQSFSDYEYSCRKKKTKREKFLDTMEDIIPWEEWIEFVRPYYPDGKRGRPVKGIEKMLRMYLLQVWFIVKALENQRSSTVKSIYSGVVVLDRRHPACVLRLAVKTFSSFPFR